jgi:hypothetical protein
VIDPVTAASAAAAAGKAVAKADDAGAELSGEAGHFLAQLSGGALQEIRASWGDRVRARRMRTQIKLLEDAQDHLRRVGRDPREVKWNLLFPLLEAASLEDDPDMAARWAALLANAADPEASDVPPSFPDILGHLSPTNARVLDGVFDAVVGTPRAREEVRIPGAGVRAVLGIDGATYALSVENLYKERLLKPTATKLSFTDNADTRYATDTVEQVMLTALGDAFVRACRREPTAARRAADRRPRGSSAAR